MQEIVLTAAQNLEIEDQALLQADPGLLTRVDHGTGSSRCRIASAMRSRPGRRRSIGYRPDTVDVVCFGRSENRTDSASA